MVKPGRRFGLTLAGVALWGSFSSGLTCSASAPTGELDAVSEMGVRSAELVEPADKSPFATAIAAATTAAQLAQSAATAEEWSAVATAWSEAIQALQAVPVDDPQWMFAQRKAREYLVNQEIALQRVEEAGAVGVFPPLGNDVLDEQLAIYLSYIATFGPPDIMVIGSSRALQGLNPQVLQRQLAQQELASPDVYTFAVNGATAQVVSFILRRLLTPEQMPQMIVWAGGSRSFNSGRIDRTFAKILESPGYEAVLRGDRPEIGWIDGEKSANGVSSAEPIPVTSINGYGFLAVNDVFDPERYYRQFPRVPGVYDDAYQRFDLEGVQTVSFRAIANFTRTHDIPLVFVNLPLSNDYLDETRLFYEQQFQQYLRAEAAAGGFTVVDLLQEWPGRDNIFADPSHLNRFGAAEVATRVAAEPTIPWATLTDQPTTAAEDMPPDTDAELETPDANLDVLEDDHSAENAAAETGSD